MRHTMPTIGVVVLCVYAIGAQGPAAGQNTIAAGQKMLHSMIKTNIIRSAEKMPEENYAFKPTPQSAQRRPDCREVTDSQSEPRK